MRQVASELDRAQSELKSAVAQHTLRKAELDQIAEQIKELKINSPCTGVVEAVDLQPGDLVAPNAPTRVTTSASDVDVITRKDGQNVYVIAVRRSSTATNKVAFSGLPLRSGGAHLSRGEVMFEYVQRPLSPPVDPTKQAFRLITVANDGFQDWFGPHDARVYRFNLA